MRATTRGKGLDDQHSSEEVARFETLYAATVGPLYRFIFSRVRNREDAEDLTSQVFMKALRGADWQREDAVLRRWLFQVAQTVMVDHWRKLGHMSMISLDTLLLEGWPGPAVSPPSAPAEDLPTEMQAADILAHLPESYRAVLRCRFILGYSIKETAQELQISEANAKVIQYRALKRAAELHTPIPPRKEATCDGSPTA